MYKFKYEPNPKNVILDLMGINQPNPLETTHLVMISDIFGISINNLRVALTRLAAKGMITNDGRGIYRLSPKTVAKRDFINRWRSAQVINKPWDNSWIACHLPKGTDRTIRKKSLLALEWYGFKPGLDLVWVRPNNLTLSLTDLVNYLRELGLESEARTFVLAQAEDTLQTHWVNNLWATKKLDQDYDELIQALQNSIQTLQQSTPQQSLFETCSLGGEAIHHLAIDPLLPQEIRPGDMHTRLKQTMLTYDKVGREIWLEQLSALGVQS